jgi:hypothetical protein
MDRERMERCLEQVSAYRASGLKAKAWAAANAVELLSLQSWCAHAARWRARLDGVESARPVRPGGFVAARLATVAPSVAAGPSVRLELGAGAGRLEMHWPLAHARELALWLREYTR